MSLIPLNYKIYVDLYSDLGQYNWKLACYIANLLICFMPGDFCFIGVNLTTFIYFYLLKTMCTFIVKLMKQRDSKCVFFFFQYYCMLLVTYIWHTRQCIPVYEPLYKMLWWIWFPTPPQEIPSLPTYPTRPKFSMTLSDTSFLDGVNVFRSPPVPM